MAGYDYSTFGKSGGSGFTIIMSGGKSLHSIFDSVGSPTFMRAVAQAVYAEANVIMRESKKEVPLDDGPLRRSGTVEPPVVQGLVWEITLGYGGTAQAYALLQHENLMFKHAPGRKAKYLEDPVRAHIPKLQSRIAARVEKFFTPTVRGS